MDIDTLVNSKDANRTATADHRGVWFLSWQQFKEFTGSSVNHLALDRDKDFGYDMRCNLAIDLDDL